MTIYLPTDANSASFPGSIGCKVVVLGTSYLGFLKVDFGSFIAEGVSAADLVEEAPVTDWEAFGAEMASEARFGC